MNSLTGTLGQPPAQELADEPISNEQLRENAFTVPQPESPFASILANRAQRKQQPQAVPAPVEEPPDVGPERTLTQPPAPETTNIAAVPTGSANVEVARTVASTDLGPEVQEKLDKVEEKRAQNEQAQLELIQSQQALEQEKLKEQQIVNDQRAEEFNELQTRMNDIRARQQQAMDEYKQKFDTYAEQKIENPWSKMSTGSKVLAGLSIFLGGLTGEGGKNAALDIINKNIEQDIALQKANLNKDKGALTMLQQYAKDLQQQGMDDINVTKAMRAMHYRKLSDKLKGMASQTLDKAKAAEMTALSENLAQTSLKEQMDVSKAAADKVSVKYASGASLMGDKKVDRAPTALLEKAINSQRGYLASVKLKKMLEQNPDMMEKIGAIAGRIAALTKYFGDENAAVLDQAIKNEILNKLRAVTGAQMTDAERQYIAQTMPSMFEDKKSFLAKLNSNIDSYRDQYTNDFNLIKGQQWFTGGLASPEEIAGWTPESAQPRN